MARDSKVMAGFVIVGLALLWAGCGGKGESVEIPEIGFSMRLPSGWTGARGTSDQSDYRQFYGPDRRDYLWGDVRLSQLESYDMFTGRTRRMSSLTEYVDDIVMSQEKMSRMYEQMGRVLGKMAGGEELGERIGQEFKEGTSQSVKSKTSRTISGYQAIEVVWDAPISSIEAYIAKGDTVITVAFRAPKEEFSKYEAAFRRSIESIKIR